ncbi:MAG: dihydrofolate reductase [Bacteroidales bacterium]|nr:dihydrofolate reductase [Bacteroidales bacterium]
MEKSLIVAIADNNAIGRKNALLWNLPGDMKYFRQQTTGCAVIMGWMTYQSIGRPLPKRHNIVISLFPWPEAPAEVTVVDSLDAAFKAASSVIPSEAKESGKAFVIGGAYTYAEAMEVVDSMYITHVHDAPEDADAFFPEIDPAVWYVDSRSELQTDPETGITYEFVVYRRK